MGDFPYYRENQTSLEPGSIKMPEPEKLHSHPFTPKPDEQEPAPAPASSAQLLPELLIHTSTNQVVEVIHYLRAHNQRPAIREWAGVNKSSIRWEHAYGNYIVKFSNGDINQLDGDELRYHCHKASTGLELIAVERHRQQSQEGWDPEHDSQHTSGEIAAAAACYANMAAGLVDLDYDKDFDDLSHDCWRGSWPQSWADSWWKPSPDPLVNLKKAGALIAAEIDRVLRERAAADKLSQSIIAEAAAAVENARRGSVGNTPEEANAQIKAVIDSKVDHKFSDGESTFDIAYKPMDVDLKFTGKPDDKLQVPLQYQAVTEDTHAKMQVHISEASSYQVPPSGDPDNLKQVLEHPEDFSFIHVSVPASPEGTSGEGFFKAMLDSSSSVVAAPPPTKPTHHWPTARWTVEYRQPSSSRGSSFGLPLQLPQRSAEVIACLNGYLIVEGHMLVFKEQLPPQSPYIEGMPGAMITKLMIHQDEVARITPHIEELAQEQAEIRAEWDRWNEWEREQRAQQRGGDKEALKADLRHQIAEAAKAQGAADKTPSKPMPSHMADFLQDSVQPIPAPPRNYRAVPRDLTNDRSNED